MSPWICTKAIEYVSYKILIFPSIFRGGVIVCCDAQKLSELGLLMRIDPVFKVCATQHLQKVRTLSQHIYQAPKMRPGCSFGDWSLIGRRFRLGFQEYNLQVSAPESTSNSSTPRHTGTGNASPPDTVGKTSPSLEVEHSSQSTSAISMGKKEERSRHR